MGTCAGSEPTRWSEEARAAFLRAAENAMETYRRYVDLVAAATGDDERERLFEAMWPSARAFADANIAEAHYSGTMGPWGSPPEPVPDEVLPEYDGQCMITLLERRDYYLEDADAVRGAIQFGYVVPEAPDEPPPARSATELLGHVLTHVAIQDGSAAVEALPGLEFTQGLVIALAHNRDENIRDAYNDETEFDIADDDVLLGTTTF